MILFRLIIVDPVSLVPSGLGVTVLAPFKEVPVSVASGVLDKGCNDPKDEEEGVGRSEESTLGVSKTLRLEVRVTRSEVEGKISLFITLCWKEELSAPT